MKRILTLGAIIAIFLTGCEVHPYADFAVNNRVVQPQDIVYFTNLSEHAVSYDWDFGDGTFSNSFSPSHVYTREGTYTVTLSVVSKDGNIDRTSLSIEVYFTELEIEVAEWNEFGTVDFIVPDARVRLYPTYDDWFEETRMVAEGYTNSNGIVRFIGLDVAVYYVDVRTLKDPFYDNSALGQEDVGFIQTPILNPGYNVYFLALADWYPIATYTQKRTNIDPQKIKRNRSTLLNSDVSK